VYVLLETLREKMGARRAAVESASAEIV